jgi:hypothetical protein
MSVQANSTSLLKSPVKTISILIPHVHPAANYLRKMNMAMNMGSKSPRFSMRLRSARGGGGLVSSVGAVSPSPGIGGTEDV